MNGRDAAPQQQRVTAGKAQTQRSIGRMGLIRLTSLRRKVMTLSKGKNSDGLHQDPM